MRHVRRQIQAYFADDLSERQTERMRAHIRSCDRCRAEYDRLAALLRVAAGREPARMEGGRVFAHVSSCLDRDDQAGAGERVGRQSRWLSLAALAAGLLLLLGVGLIISGEPGPQPRRVQLRGGDGPVLTMLEVFGITPRDGGGYYAPRLLEDGATLQRRDLIQLRYRTSDTSLRYLYVFGLDERRAPLDYFPRPSNGRAESVLVSGPTGALSPSMRLEVRHQRGPLRIYALFSSRPLKRATVHGAVASAGRGGGLPDTITLRAADEVSIVARRFKIIGDEQPENRSDK